MAIMIRDYAPCDAACSQITLSNHVIIIISIIQLLTFLSVLLYD